MLLPELAFYARFVWPLNMVVLGVLSVGIFAQRSAAHRAFKNGVTLAVIAIPTGLAFVPPSGTVMLGLSVCYMVFFLIILVEVFRHLLRPRYIDADLVSAAICGYFLLLETGIFLMQALYYAVPGGFRGIDTSSFPAIYLDLVYFCSIVLTSIGFGDITPAHHVTKLAAALLGITGQTYSVVLVGILISKYTSAETK